MYDSAYLMESSWASMIWLRSFSAWYSLAIFASFSVMSLDAPRTDSVVLGSTYKQQQRLA